jgi:hypothetical protein
MEVSRSRWHYRYLDWLGWAKPTSLCPYFWKVVWAIFLTGIAPVVLLSIAGVMAWYHIWGPFVFIGVCALVVLFWVGIAFAAIYLEDAKPWRKITQSDNLTVEFIRARKNKLCPTLTFK